MITQEKEIEEPPQLASIIGKHATADFTDCKVSLEFLDDIENIRNHMIEAANRANATVVSDHFHKFAPVGISGVVILAESDLSIHIWAKERFVSVGCYTCGDDADPLKAIEYLREVFDPAHAEIDFKKRGPKI